MLAENQGEMDVAHPAAHHFRHRAMRARKPAPDRLIADSGQRGAVLRQAVLLAAPTRISSDSVGGLPRENRQAPSSGFVTVTVTDTSPPNTLAALPCVSHGQAAGGAGCACGTALGAVLCDAAGEAQHANSRAGKRSARIVQGQVFRFAAGIGPELRILPPSWMT